ncbi:hypothetical protein F4810DRAFT_658155 [Camillea tinctor]|nr:hypothetical protein F4810DRAFT_658155 [Camillea tinctor]
MSQNEDRYDGSSTTRRRQYLAELQSTSSEIIPSLVPMIFAVNNRKCWNTRPACGICIEEEQSIRKIACGHNICKSCICGIVEAAFSNRTMWPPMCCHRYFNEHDIAWAGGADMVAKYRRVDRELYGRNLTYCSRPQCSELLDNSGLDVEGMLTCKACGTRTCVKCKQDSHEKHGCVKREDPALEAIMKREKWQKCQRCGRIISLGSGCNHMQCLCGFNFCYVCGRRWGYCDCTQAFFFQRMDMAIPGLIERSRPSSSGDSQQTITPHHPPLEFIEVKGEDMYQQYGDSDYGLKDTGGSIGDSKYNEDSAPEGKGKGKDKQVNKSDTKSNNNNDNGYLRELLSSIPFHHQLPAYLQLRPSPSAQKQQQQQKQKQ